MRCGNLSRLGVENIHVKVIDDEVFLSCFFRGLSVEMARRST